MCFLAYVEEDLFWELCFPHVARHSDKSSPNHNTDYIENTLVKPVLNPTGIQLLKEKIFLY